MLYHLAITPTGPPEKYSVVDRHIADRRAYTTCFDYAGVYGVSDSPVSKQTRSRTCACSPAPVNTRGSWRVSVCVGRRACPWSWVSSKRASCVYRHGCSATLAQCGASIDVCMYSRPALTLRRRRRQRRSLAVGGLTKSVECVRAHTHRDGPRRRAVVECSTVRAHTCMYAYGLSVCMCTCCTLCMHTRVRAHCQHGRSRLYGVDIDWMGLVHVALDVQSCCHTRRQLAVRHHQHMGLTIGW